MRLLRKKWGGPATDERADGLRLGATAGDLARSSMTDEIGGNQDRVGSNYRLGPNDDEVSKVQL